jgi:hypothetical protein
VTRQEKEKKRFSNGKRGRKTPLISICRSHGPIYRNSKESVKRAGVDTKVIYRAY